MNYALDALWWRLTNPYVRDLASILTAPVLWHSGDELPVRTLLGEQGFRYLLNLNDESDFSLPETSPILGRYAEDLLAFWLANAPHSRLLARNVAVRDDDGRVLGEWDYLVELNGITYHLELTCKYFAAHDGLPEAMCGLNRQDTLLKKMNKLKTQLACSQTPQGRAALADYGLDADRVRCASVVRGMAFTDSGILPNHAVYAVNAWTGQLWAVGQGVADSSVRFYRLARHEYLAPARVALEQTCTFSELNQEEGLIALVQRRADGYWHEVGRWMWRLA